MTNKKLVLALLSILITMGSGCKQASQQPGTDTKCDSATITASISNAEDEGANSDTMQLLSILQPVDFDATKMDKINKLYKDIEDCARDGREPAHDGLSACPRHPDCSAQNVYCSNGDCPSKILCCHGVDESLFNGMIRGHENDSVHVPVQKIRDAISSAHCNTNKVRFRMRRNLFTGRCKAYIVAVKPDEDQHRSYTSYFSYLLINTIVESLQPDTIIMYRGLSLNEDGKQHHIVPIAVVTGNNIKYFDLTDSQP